MRRQVLSSKRKKIIAAITLVIVCGTLLFGVLFVGEKFGWGDLAPQTKVSYADNSLPDEYLKTDWSGDWIWCENSKIAQWVIFRKDVECPEQPEKSYLDIAADTHYWLWVNGELVVFEGNAKRGASPDDGYYDHIETNAFVQGKNSVAILVNYLGDSGYSHIDSGHGGLRLDGAAGDVRFCSDESFVAKEYSAYKYRWYDTINNLNFRLSERTSNIFGKDLEEFWLPQTDCSTWNNAVVLKGTDAESFGDTYQNILPQKFFAEIRPFENFSDYEGKYFSKK